MNMPHEPITYSQEKAKELEELSQASPGTPMGRLLRRFWQPITASDKVKPGTAIPVKLLSEDLTLYRVKVVVPTSSLTGVHIAVRFCMPAG
jgi:hypothetical protein